MDHARFQRTEPKFSHWQILDERNHRMHWWYWPGQLHHLHNARSDIRILADAIGLGFTKTDNIHHSQQRPVPLDHLSNGLTGLPCQLPKSDGRSSLWHTEHTGVHQRSTSAHRHAREAPWSTGASSSQATQKSLEDKPGEMRLWKQGSFLSQFYTYAWWNQTRKEQAQGHQGCQTTHRYKNYQVFCVAVQFLPDPYQGFCTHRSIAFQTHTKGFGLQIWPSSGSSLTSLLCTAEITYLGTGNGVPQGWPTIGAHHGCGHRHCWHPWQTRHNPNPSQQWGELLHHFLWITSVKGPWKSYSPLEAAATVWGMDFFNEYLRGEQIILCTNIWRN